MYKLISLKRNWKIYSFEVHQKDPFMGNMVILWISSVSYHQKNKYNVKKSYTESSGDVMRSANSKMREKGENPHSILKHGRSMKARSTKGLRFEESSSEDEQVSERSYTRVTRRSIAKTRSRTRNEEREKQTEDSD